MPEPTTTVVTPPNSPPAPPPGPPPPAPPAPPQNPEWFAGFKDPLAIEHAKKAGYPDPEAAVLAHMNVEKLIGAPQSDIIRKPATGYEVDPKPWDAALKTLGAPENPDAYATVFKPVDGLGELPAETRTAAAQLFLDAKLLPHQAAKVMEGFSKIALAQKGDADKVAGEADTKRMAALDAYKAERGGAFAEDVKGASSLIQKFDTPGVKGADGKVGPGELESYLNETKLGDDPRMIKFLRNIHARVDPSNFTVDPGRVDVGSGMTKGQASAELAKLEADPGFRTQLNTRGDPNHATAVARRLELIRLAEGG